MADVVKITFPDGAVKEFPKGVTTEEIAASISPGLKKKAVAGKLNDEMIDLVTKCGGKMGQHKRGHVCSKRITDQYNVFFLPIFI